jgi:hypothetical protein
MNRSDWDRRYDASYRVHKKDLQGKIRRASGWSFRTPPDLPTDFKYEILQYADGDYAFRVWINKARQEKTYNIPPVTELWLHPSPDQENIWELYPKRKNMTKHNDWEKVIVWALTWDDERQCFTKGVNVLPLYVVNTIEMFNELVRKSKNGFENSDDARVIFGEAPFEESNV